MGDLFLLSPANLKGVRGRRLFDADSSSALARRLRHSDGVPIGEVYTHVSQLYFRGKLSYSLHFGGREATRVIIPGFGLVCADWPLTLERMEAIASVPVDPKVDAYREPLARDVAALDHGSVVFLGSLATRKYLDVLVPILGPRLHYPEVFLGCGDMRRGSLCLKAVEADRPLKVVRWIEPEASSRR